MRGFNTYKCALYENIVADMMVKSGYDLYFYRNPKSTMELDFMVRDRESLVPVEVKAVDGGSKSLKHAIKKKEYTDIQYGIKFADKNIGFNGLFYTFPYFLVFFLKNILRSILSHIERVE